MMKEIKQHRKKKQIRDLDGRMVNRYLRNSKRLE